MSQHLVEIRSAILFAEYLQSLGFSAMNSIGNRRSICRTGTWPRCNAFRASCAFYLRANALARS